MTRLGVLLAAGFCCFGVRAEPPAASGWLVYGSDSQAARLIRFGKLTMTDADLQLIDADDRDWFHFSPAEYDRQRSPAIRRTPRRWGS